MHTETTTTLDQMFSDYTVVHSAGTGQMPGATVLQGRSQPYFEEDPDGDDHSLADGWELLTGFTWIFLRGSPAVQGREETQY